MIKAIKWLVKALFWLQAFACPLLVFGLLSFFLYNKGEQNKIIAFILLGSGIVAGVFFAEWIRKKYGLEKFFSNAYGSGGSDKPENNKD